MVHEGYLAWTLIGQNNFCFSLLNIEWLFTGACHNLVHIPSIVLKCLPYSQTYDFDCCVQMTRQVGTSMLGFHVRRLKDRHQTYELVIQSSK